MEGPGDQGKENMSDNEKREIISDNIWVGNQGKSICIFHARLKSDIKSNVK